MNYKVWYEYARTRGASVTASHEFANFVSGYKIGKPFWRKINLKKLYERF